MVFNDGESDGDRPNEGEALNVKDDAYCVERRRITMIASGVNEIIGPRSWVVDWVRVRVQ